MASIVGSVQAVMTAYLCHVYFPDVNLEVDHLIKHVGSNATARIVECAERSREGHYTIRVDLAFYGVRWPNIKDGHRQVHEEWWCPRHHFETGRCNEKCCLRWRAHWIKQGAWHQKDELIWIGSAYA